MGRQINFYLSEHDQEEFCRRLDALGGILAILPPLPQPVTNGQSVLTYSHWRPGEYNPVLFRSVDDGKLVFRHSARGYFVDEMRSPVVEFLRCSTDGAELRRGRLYYTAQYFDDNDRKISKDTDFEKWASKIFKIARGVCIGEWDGALIGKEAQSMIQRGYKCVF